MKSNKALLLAILVGILFLLGLPQAIVLAQGGEHKEEFNDETLKGWEHSEGVEIDNGVLTISPENFMILFDDFQADSYSFDLKRSAPGLIIFRYGINEGQEYALVLHDEAIFLELAQEGSPILLGESPWEPRANEWITVDIKSSATGQQVSVDGNLLLSTEEEEVIKGGGIGFWVEGESAVEFDNLVRLGESQQEAAEPEVHADEPPEASQEIESSPAEEDTINGRLSMDDLINELTTAQANPTQLSTFLINLGLAVVLSFILSRVYVHWGSSLSNRRRFAANFILITVTTTFIILVVRSSVALSLGLVGALSIVRFRSAIKEPEELAYLFFAIAIGIGLGDNQRLITVIALATAILVLGIMRLFRGRGADFNLHLTIRNQGSEKVSFDAVVESLKKNTSQLKLIRFDENDQSQEISFLVEFTNMDQLNQARSALGNLSEYLEISFLDNKGIW